MSIHNTQSRIGLAAAVALVALISSPAAQAQMAGQQAAKDPVTGQLVAPTAAQSAALSRTAAPRGLLTGKVGPRQIQHADGSIEQELDESSLSYTVVTRAADGTLDTDCVTGKDAADALVASKKTAKPSKARHLELK